MIDPDGMSAEGPPGCCDVVSTVKTVYHTLVKPLVKATDKAIIRLINAPGNYQLASQASTPQARAEAKNEFKGAVADVAVAVATDGLLSRGAATLKAAATADVSATVTTTTHSPSFIVDGSGQTFPVPSGATGPTPVINGAGNQTGVAFTGGEGGANGQVSTMRIMDPTPARGNSPGYPNGYVKYENNASPTPQAVNPTTGQTASKATTHYPIQN